MPKNARSCGRLANRQTATATTDKDRIRCVCDTLGVHQSAALIRVAASAMVPEPDLVDKLIRFLAKREGIDKVRNAPMSLAHGRLRTHSMLVARRP